MPDHALHQLSDAELVKLAAGTGSEAEAAFTELYVRSRGLVVQIARRFAGDDELALEIAQETYAYLLRQLPKLRLSGRLTTYLYPIARNLALDAKRRERRSQARAERSADRAMESRSASEMHVEAASLAAAIDALPDPQREVLLMRVVDGMSVEEVSVALGVPPGTVKSRLHHALEALRARPELRMYWE